MKKKYDYSSAEFINQIWKLALCRLSNNEIAQHLNISGETFRRYIKLNPVIGQTLAAGRFKIFEPLCDTDIPDVDLLE